MSSRRPALAAAPRRSVGGRPRQGEAALRQRRVIAVALELFLQHGYHHASLALIAREAQVAVRTLYSDFGGKEGLFGAVLQEQRARYLDDALLLDPAASLPAVLASFGLRHVLLLADPRVTRLRHMVLAESNSSPELAQAWRDAGPARTYSLLSAYFNDVRVRQQLRPDTPLDLLPAHFIACIAGDSLWPSASPRLPTGGRSLTQLFEARLGLFLRSVLSC